MKVKTLTSSALVCLLAACGGGGGGGSGSTATVDAANQADGLGDDGHAPGTVDLGSALQPNALGGGIFRVASALSDDGRATVAWRKSPDSAGAAAVAWSQSTTNSAWSAPANIAGTQDIHPAYGLILRGNPAGNLVLGWVEQTDTATAQGPVSSSRRQAKRFIMGQGWESNKIDLSGGSPGTFGFTSAWDLTLLADNTITTTVRLPGSTLGSARSAILKVSPSGVQSTLAPSTDQQLGLLTQSTNFTPKSTGYGIYYHTENSTSKPGWVDVLAQLVDVNQLAFKAFALGTYGGLCSTPDYDEPIVGAITPQADGVAALLTADLSQEQPSCNQHELQLVRSYLATSIRVETHRANSPGTFLWVAPVVATDQNGNALAVWKEVDGNNNLVDSDRTVRLMWSQSLYGQPWTAAQPLISNLSALGSVPVNGHISLAMNPAGKAVAAVILKDTRGRWFNASIGVGTFDFTHGWSAWKRVANKRDLTEPQVAVNASGQALVAYVGRTGKRINGEAPAFFNGPTDERAYALRF
jgi:hypothetical protein